MTARDLRAPYPGAVPHLRLAQDAWDDVDWLRDAMRTTACATAAAQAAKRLARQIRA